MIVDVVVISSKNQILSGDGLRQYRRACAKQSAIQKIKARAKDVYYNGPHK